MLRVFNSMQFVACLIGAPYFINWLTTNPFPYAPLAMYTASAAYVVMVIFTIVAIANLAEEMK